MHLINLITCIEIILKFDKEKFIFTCEKKKILRIELFQL